MVLDSLTRMAICNISWNHFSCDQSRGSELVYIELQVTKIRTTRFSGDSCFGKSLLFTTLHSAKTVTRVRTNCGDERYWFGLDKTFKYYNKDLHNST
jgi:hypothetical protein